MIQWMKMDMVKTDWKMYLLGFGLLNMIIVSCIWLLLHAINPADMKLMYPIFPSYRFVYEWIITASKFGTTIFEAVLLVGIILNEYKNKTILILFQYPYPRWKLLLSKILLIGLLAFTFFSCTTVVSFIGFMTMNTFDAMIYEPITSLLSVHLILEIMIQGLGTVAIGFIPLFFGMIHKSVKTTWITSTLLAFLIHLPINAPNERMIYGTKPILYIPLAIAGIMVTVHFIYQANNRDVS
ncbi:hypothetical protein IC619_011000 [Hazenella sp. IB182353]|uniref:hypothetical protein n=1 Tax=Polycladospora coralii TaxID=2771432 RepID=UPI00174702B0|nr:hypothetical protein [Polycladospora coralii]MBS7531020.1 hypothetical protein [Polycladospora coralii]